MDWPQALFIVFGNLAVILPLWLWIRSESRADYRQMHAEIMQDRRDFIQAIRSIDNSINEIKLESKEFHFRLLEIEKHRK